MSASLPLGLRPGGRFPGWLRIRPQLVVADVDGTMIASGRLASSRVAGAVALTVPNVRVGLATGRLAAGVATLREQLRLPGPFLLQNGAQVVDRGEVVRSWPLPRPAVRALRQWHQTSGFYLELHTADAFFVSDSRDWARQTWELVSGAPAGLVQPETWEDARLLRAVVVLPSAEHLPEVRSQLEQLGLGADVATSPLFPGASFINLTDPAVDKGSALVWTADYLGIALEAVVAIGDGVNDLSMFAVAGTAIAMGQSVPQVQAAAHLVVPEVGADGAAHALAAAVAGWT